MDQVERRRAKAQLVANMAEGRSWREAAAEAGLVISRSAAYRLAQRARREGATALEDHRHGYPSKLTAPLRQWLVATCRDAPVQSGRMLQAALEAQCGLKVSVGHLNALRAQWNLRRPTGGAEKNRPSTPSEPTWQEGAGSLLLLAAAQETGVIAALEQALPGAAPTPLRLARSTPTTRRQSLLTLLLLPAVGLRRPCD